MNNVNKAIQGGKRMEKLEGKQVAVSMLEQFSKVRDLIYYEGALLSHFRNSAGQNFFYSWCDCSDEVHRWMVWEVSEADIKQYLNNQKSLRNLLTNESVKTVYVADIDDNVKVKRLIAVQTGNLPESYLPTADSFFEGV